MERTPKIKPEDYQEMLEMQHHVCLICRLPEFKRKRLSVDHDHKTGQIRGLLCNSCNLGLGLFKDNEIYLQRAINYLKAERILNGE